MQELFRRFAHQVSKAVGSVWAFIGFIGSVALTGWYYEFSERWETNISFLIAVVTLAVLFFLQKSQNHSDKATHLKLDELIKAMEGARNEVLSIETKNDEQIESLRDEHLELFKESDEIIEIKVETITALNLKDSPDERRSDQSQR